MAVSRMVLWVVLLFVTVLPAVAEVVPNPGFEAGADGAVTAWLLDARTPVPSGQGVMSAQGVWVTWAEGSAGSGQHCLRMEGHGRADGDFAIVTSPSLRLLAGYSYEMALSYRASGLVAESGDRKQHSALILDLFFESRQGFVSASRILTSVSSAGWTRLSQRFTVRARCEWAQARLQLVNKYPDARVILDWDDVSIQPLDP